MAINKILLNGDLIVDFSLTSANESLVSEDATFYNKSGELVKGTLLKLPDLTITPSDKLVILRDNSYIPAGTEIQILGDSNLKPENIRKDVTIFNVTGTLVDRNVDISKMIELDDDPPTKLSFWPGVSVVRAGFMKGNTHFTTIESQNVVYFGSESFKDSAVELLDASQAAVYPSFSTYSFSNSALKEVILSKQKYTEYTCIEDFAFFNATELEKFYISGEPEASRKGLLDLSNYHTIGQCAFANCKKITKIKFYEHSPTRFYGNSFYSQSIQEIDFGAVGAYGDMSPIDFDITKFTKLKTVKTSDPINLFRAISFKGTTIQSFEYPQSYEKLSIPENEFENCGKLDEITHFGSILYFGNYSFKNTGFGNQTLNFGTDFNDGDRVIIGQEAFCGCDASNINLGVEDTQNTFYIGKNAFGDMFSAYEINVYGECDLGSQAFYNNLFRIINFHKLPFLTAEDSLLLNEAYTDAEIFVYEKDLLELARRGAIDLNVTTTDSVQYWRWRNILQLNTGENYRFTIRTFERPWARPIFLGYDNVNNEAIITYQ